MLRCTPAHSGSNGKIEKEEDHQVSAEEECLWCGLPGGMCGRLHRLGKHLPVQRLCCSLLPDLPLVNAFNLIQLYNWT